MLDPQFKTYLDTIKKLPTLPPEAAMRTAFADAGWSPSEIDEALRYVKPTPVAPPASSPLPPQPVAAPAVSRTPISAAAASVRPAPMLQDVKPLTSAGAIPPVQPKVAWPAPTPTVVAPVQPAQGAFNSSLPKTAPVVMPQTVADAVKSLEASRPTSSIAPVKRSSRRWIIGTCIALLAAAAGGFAYAYFEKVGPFAVAPYDTTNFATGIVENYLKVKTLSYSMDSTLTTQKRNESVPYLFDVAPTTQPIPGTTTLPTGALQLNLSTSGVIDNSSTTAPAFTSHLVLDGAFLGTAGKLDAEIILKGDVGYINVHSLPDYFVKGVALDQIKNKWIRVTLQDLQNMTGDFSVPLAEERARLLAKKDMLAEIIRSAAHVADNARLFVFKSDPVQETVDGVRLYRYDLALSKEGVALFAQQIASLISAPKLGAAQSTGFLDSPFATQIVNYLAEHGTISVWVDPSTGALAKHDIAISVAPGGSQQLKDIQIDYRSRSAFSGYGTAPEVVAPESSMTLEDALVSLAGFDRAEYSFIKNAQIIVLIRSGLARYYDATGKYPATLAELQALLGSRDIGQILSYSSDGITYRLSYQVDLPVYASSTRIANEVAIYGTKPTSGLKLLAGANTATEKTLSLEADAAGIKDTDKDGVSDTLEQYIGMDPKVKDSDKDGIADAAELSALMTGTGLPSLSLPVPAIPSR